jgi:hypothetical protein
VERVGRKGRGGGGEGRDRGGGGDEELSDRPSAFFSKGCA